MAKRLLGKEVTAALNERIKADVAALEAKGVKPTLGIIRVGENEVISPTKEGRRNAAKRWELRVKRSFFLQMYLRKNCLQLLIK